MSSAGKLQEAVFGFAFRGREMATKAFRVLNDKLKNRGRTNNLVKMGNSHLNKRRDNGRRVRVLPPLRPRSSRKTLLHEENENEFGEENGLGDGSGVRRKDIKLTNTFPSTEGPFNLPADTIERKNQRSRPRIVRKIGDEETEPSEKEGVRVGSAFIFFCLIKTAFTGFLCFFVR